MINYTKLAQEFLTNLASKGSSEVFESLSLLAENLETKNDPEPSEVQLVSNIYEFIEKLRILESSLKNYVKESRENLPGNHLDRLYNEYSKNNIFGD